MSDIGLQIGAKSTATPAELAAGKPVGWPAALRRVSAPGMAAQAALLAFALRLASAVITYAMQIWLARSIGAGEYGIYVYVWSVVLIVGHLAGLGFSLSAPRLIADLKARHDLAGLRGFLRMSRIIAVISATIVAAMMINAISLIGAIEDAHVAPLILVLCCLPLFTLTEIQDALARCHDAPLLGLAPPYLLRPLLLVAVALAALAAGFTPNARTIAVSAVIATWATGIVQAVLLSRLLAKRIAAGPLSYATPAWLAASLPLLVSEGSRIVMQNSDVVILAFLATPQDVGAYYAVTKTMVLGAFVAFAVGAAVSHRLAAHHADGEKERLAAIMRQSTGWMFFASFVSLALMLALGRPFLALFGDEFVPHYPLMFVLALGFLVRASIGPAERLLAAIGDQAGCARVYVIVLLTGLVLQLVLAYVSGVAGLAIAAALTLIIETVLLTLAAWRRHRLVLGIWRRGPIIHA